MKNTLLLGALLLGTASLFTSCKDDNDSNPTLLQPTEFKLNTPAYINQDIVLENTPQLPLSWSQPNYTAENAPINATYEIQMSLNNSFTVSKAQATEDESLTADYISLDKTYTVCNASLQTSDIDKALNQLGSWTSESLVPETTPVYVRLVSYILEGSKKINSIASNVVKLNVKPYYMELRDAEPIMWYLVGNNILDGMWSDKPGESSMPMFIKPGTKYDKTTGAGEIEYLNYFTTDAWKIQPADFNWDYGFMNGGSANTAKYRNAEGDAGNIWCDPAGYYLVTVNTKDNTCTIEPQSITPAVYTTVSIIGLNDDWNTDIALTPVNKAEENHVWVATITTTQTTQFKFRANNAWDVNWGYGSFDGEVNTMGKCSNGGPNIGIDAGKWLLMFNDINGVFNVRASK